MSILNNGYFHDEAAAFAKLESVLWPDGPVCPHCGNTQKIYDLASTRIGLKKCGACRKQFTVRFGTVFEASHIPLHKWLQAIYLLCCSRKRISARQLHRVLDVSYKTAWLMRNRIREAMGAGAQVPMRNESGKVERDKTSIRRKTGKKRKPPKKGRGYAHEHTVVSLVERGYHSRATPANRGQVIVVVHENRCSDFHSARPCDVTVFN
jgi:transposase-like protein